MESITNMKRTSANGRPIITRRPRVDGKAIFFSISMAMLFLLVLHGCTEEDMDNPKADSFNGTVTAKVENGASYEAQISKVYALYESKVSSAGELTGMSLGNGDYANGGFTLNMDDIPGSSLMSIQSFFSSGLNISATLDIDETDARILDADFFGITNNNNYVDYFTYAKTGTKRTTCLFVFVNVDVTVKGKNVGVALRRGWNRIYWTPADNKVTSSAPSGMKWYLNSQAK